MYLNADIVSMGLSESFTVRHYGPREVELNLKRPHLLKDSCEKLEKNHLYVASGKHLPRRPPIQPGVVLVCIGESEYLDHYKNHCCVLLLEKDADFCEVFNLLQLIFDKYDLWERDLITILEGKASIEEMLRRSQNIFNNPMFVIDTNFSLKGQVGLSADASKSLYEDPFNGVNLYPTALHTFMEASELSMQVPEPFVINILDESILNQNLLQEDKYLGCLTMLYQNHQHRPSDKPLIKFLGTLIKRAMILQQNSEENHADGTLRQAIKDLVHGNSLSSMEKIALESAAEKRFICARLRPRSGLDQLPLGYICNTLESEIPEAIAFEYNKNSVAAFINLDSIQAKPRAEVKAVTELFLSYSNLIELQVGISDPIDDLSNAFIFFNQANVALEIGSIANPSERIYDFQSCALTNMIINSIDTLPLEYMLTPGLKRLLKHDEVSNTSYVETLQKLLDLNMNISQTAQALFVHRSTLLERLTRIRRELDGELDSPEGCLRLRMLLKALEIQGSIQGSFM